MRPLYLRAIPVGTLLVLIALPAFIILVVLGVFSKKVQKGFEEMFGGEDG